MNDDMDRRSFLGVASLALSALVGAPQLAAAARRARVPNAPYSAVMVRPEIHSAAGLAMVPSLRAGVAAMKARLATDPTSWIYQANMHGTYDSVLKPQWATCQHGQYFFLSWHRMYLYYFEQILRAASGNAAFALPYWNYEIATQRHLPPAFRSPANAGNALYEPDRGSGMNDGTGELPAANVDSSWALAATVFNGSASAGGFAGSVVPAPQHFSSGFGRLEQLPHNYVHDDIGGLMGDPNTAANDPIFWLHHANIDRLWNHWIALGGGRTNPSSGAWATTTFTFFKPDGSSVQMTGADVVNSAAQLNYRYDTDTVLTAGQLSAILDRLKNLRLQYPVRPFHIPPRPWPPVPPAPWSVLVLKSSRAITVGPGQAQTVIDVPGAVRQQMQQPKLKTALSTKARRLVLSLEGIDMSRPPGGTIDVFVVPGQPEGEKLRTALAREDGAYYAGTLDFFGLIGQLHQAGQRGLRGANVIVDVTDQLQTLLGATGEDASSISVVFRPRGGGTNEKMAVRQLAHPFTVARVAIRPL